METFEKVWVDNEFKEEFEQYLQRFVEEVLSSDFEHNPASRYCVLC